MSNKTKSTQRSAEAIQTSFSLRRTTLRRLKEAAAADNRSASNLVNRIVEEFLAKQEAEKLEAEKRGKSES